MLLDLQAHGVSVAVTRTIPLVSAAQSPPSLSHQVSPLPIHTALSHRTPSAALCQGQAQPQDDEDPHVLGNATPGQPQPHAWHHPSRPQLRPVPRSRGCRRPRSQPSPPAPSEPQQVPSPVRFPGGKRELGQSRTRKWCPTAAASPRWVANSSPLLCRLENPVLEVIFLLPEGALPPRWSETAMGGFGSVPPAAPQPKPSPGEMMGFAAGSCAKKELFLIKQLQSGAKRVSTRGGTAWRASLARPQSRRDRRNKTIFVARQRSRGPARRQVGAGLRRLPSEDAGASRRRHRIPPAASPGAVLPTAGHRCSPRGKRRSRMVQPRGSQAAGAPGALALCNDLAAGTHSSLLRCLALSPADRLLPARRRGRGSAGAASQGHAAPWARGHGSCPPGETRVEPGTFPSPAPPPRVRAIALAIPSRRKTVFLVGGGEPLGDGANPVIVCARHPHGRRGLAKRGDPDPVLPPQQGAWLDPAELTAPASLPRSPALPSEEIWGFLHAVSRLQRCVNWIRWEAERDADLEELLSGARLPPV